MTTVPPESETEFDLRIASEKENRLDRWLDTASGWFSPLLVKETRQALKSRQFVYTFFLLMALVVTCLIIGITITTDLGSVEFSSGLLSTFLVILGFPLFIVIPFTAFRSLASEYEDGTLQLVSITSMKPYQIIVGKFGSAALQMIIYLAVLAPCIAFTYLLRGLDIRVIMYCLLLCTVSSICLTSVGLFAGAITSSRAMGAGIAVLLLLLLGFCYFLWIVFATTGASELPQMLASGGKIVLDAFFSATITSSILAFAAAAAMLTFYADNRATKLRAAMLLQQTLFLGWSAAIVVYDSNQYVWFGLSIVMCHYWLIMGSMMSFVPAGMSHRVRRSLPGTALTKSSFALFFPGPGRGFLFALSNMVAATFWLAFIAIFAKTLLPGAPSENFNGGQSIARFTYSDMNEVLLYLVGNLVYATFFLCVVFLIGRMINRMSKQLMPILGLVVGIIVMLFFTLIGMVIQINFRRLSGYTVLQTFNWYWTLGKISSSSSTLYDLCVAPFGNSRALVALFFMTFLTGALTLFAIFWASRDLRETTAVVPERVLEDKKKQKVKEVPKGETIDDIFGVLPPKSERGNHEAQDDDNAESNPSE